ncbi:MAG: DoxX family protein [Candidatus Paceibacterota bacterium]
MSKSARFILVLLRIGMGWLFLYTGITKVLNPEWTSAGYISGAKTLTSLYSWLGSAEIIQYVDFVNKWGLVLIGVSLIFGLFVRFSAPLGALLMLLYWIPLLSFPYVGEHSYIVDDHIIYILILLFFAAVGAGRYFGLDRTFGRD